MRLNEQQTAAIQKLTENDLLEFLDEAQNDQTVNNVTSTLLSLGEMAEELTTVQCLSSLVDVVVCYAARAESITERNTARNAGLALADVIQLNTTIANYSRTLTVIDYAVNRYKNTESKMLRYKDLQEFYEGKNCKLAYTDEPVKDLEEDKQK
jgi:hypothetical protein